MSGNSDSNGFGGYLASFVLGAAIGAGLALLYAPRSGKETRQLLAEKGRTVQGKLSDTVEDAKGFVRAKQAELHAAFEAGKKAMQEERARQEQARG